MKASEKPGELSISLVHGVGYELPGDRDDRAGIDGFLSRNSGKPVVVVQGLGFVDGGADNVGGAIGATRAGPEPYGAVFVGGAGKDGHEECCKDDQAVLVDLHT